MGKADLHLHTRFSDGMANARELLDHVELHTDLDVIAVTDHDDVRGALIAREAWAKGNYRFDFIPGVEITTIEGHLLALFVEEPLPTLCRLEEALEAVNKRGGVCVAPHPLNPFTRSLGVPDLRRAAAEGLHGIEAANCSPGSGLRRRKALAANKDHWKLAEVGGSDAHFLDFVGAAYTEFSGRGASELKEAIITRKTTARHGRIPSLRQIGPRRLLAQTWRGFTTTPRRMGWGPTARSFVRRIVQVR
ncbi:MAG TPA: PHP-associated domain-containing protein [Dehalococcoidia bacterium]|nr:PHP-associated domain-containing protein [Dehalococcoidia bacterium]